MTQPWPVIVSSPGPSVPWRVRGAHHIRPFGAKQAVTFDKKAQMVRLVQHRVFTPAPGDPINFEPSSIGAGGLC